jgi:hypothetical protein
MNDIPYDELFADLFEADTTYQEASTQVRCGYLTLAASFHWNLLQSAETAWPRRADLSPPDLRLRHWPRGSLRDGNTRLATGRIYSTRR